jgi:hypothetical protein
MKAYDEDYHSCEIKCKYILYNLIYIVSQLIIPSYNQIKINHSKSLCLLLFNFRKPPD